MQQCKHHVNKNRAQHKNYNNGTHHSREGAGLVMEGGGAGSEQFPIEVSRFLRLRVLMDVMQYD